MLANIHTTIQDLLHTHGRIPADAVDIWFEMPTKAWVESLTRPTLSAYLFDIVENTDLRQSNMQAARANGQAVLRMPPRRFDLRYMVSALTTEVADEHMLIWRVLATLLKYQQFPVDVLAHTAQAILRRAGHADPQAELEHFAAGQTLTLGLLRAFAEAQDVSAEIRAELYTLTPDPPLATKVVKSDEGTRLLDIWSALEQPPRPSLLYVVTAPLDLDIEFTAPLVLTRTTRYTRTTGADELRGQGIDPARITSRNPSRAPQDGVIVAGSRIGIGGVVRDREGKPLHGVVVAIDGSAGPGSVTTAEGQFVLSGLQAGAVKLRVVGINGVSTVVTIEIPSDSYDITLE